jgi:hypothetical protein
MRRLRSGADYLPRRVFAFFADAFFGELFFAAGFFAPDFAAPFFWAPDFFASGFPMPDFFASDDLAGGGAAGAFSD